MNNLETSLKDLSFWKELGAASLFVISSLTFLTSMAGIGYQKLESYNQQRNPEFMVQVFRKQGYRSQKEVESAWENNIERFYLAFMLSPAFALLGYRAWKKQDEGNSSSSFTPSP